MWTKIILLLFFITHLYSETLEIKNITFITENDADFRNDNDYTYGSELGALFYRKDLSNSFLHIPFTDYKNQDNYLSFSYAQKIYTPKDLEAATLISDDRAYAGYMYIKSSLHQASQDSLQSLSLQLGMVGPATKMDKVQEVIHSLIGSDDPQGWKYQLKNEFIMQLNYSHKEYMELSETIALIPEYGFELGNASTKIYAMTFLRWGENLPEDYGSTQISNTNYNKVPRRLNQKYLNRWSYCFNFSFKGNLIARDIFLDGNSFRDSHSVEKNIFVAEVGYGFSLNYEKFSIEYLRKHLSDAFKTQERYPNYGSLVCSYNF
jgi:hypothetical protein